MKKNNNLKNYYLMTVLGLIVLSLVLIIMAQNIKSEFWKSITNNIGTTLFISGGFGLLDQFILKEKLVELILEKLKIKEEIDKTGIESIFYDINQIDYSYYIKKSTSNIDILHIYGMSWTNKYIDVFKDKVLNSNCKIRVILLSPDSAIAPGLAEHFNYSNDDLKKKITEVTKVWKEILLEKNKQKKKKTQSEITVYYHNGNPSYSIYRMDDRIIHVPGKLTKGRSTKLPSMVLKNTNQTEDLYSLYLDQVEKLISESQIVDLNSI